MKEELKLCKDCKWVKLSPLRINSKCSEPRVQKIDVVMGEKEDIICWIARSNESGCGPKGRFWERR